MRCSGRSTRPVILATKASPRPKMSRARSTSWSACEVCGRSLAAKISVLGKRPCLRFVLVGVALELLEDLAVGVRRGDLALDLGGVEGALVLEEVELAGAGLGVDLVDLLALVEEDAVHADVRA